MYFVHNKTRTKIKKKKEIMCVKVTQGKETIVDPVHVLLLQETDTEAMIVDTKSTVALIMIVMHRDKNLIRET